MNSSNRYGPELKRAVTLQIDETNNIDFTLPLGDPI